MLYYLTIAFVASVMTGISQVLLKKGANKEGNIKIFFNFFTLTGYFVFFIITLMNLFVYKKLELKYSVIFMPLGFVFVMFFSVLLLKEKISKRKLLGIFVIILGVYIFNLK